MSRKYLHIVHLYPKEMNIYGDTGNTLVLKKRLEWRDIEARVSLIGIGDPIPENADIILGGGGQDAGQDKIQSDLQAKSEQLHKLAKDGVVMFMVCGLYQLFGRSFTTADNNVIQGISLFPMETAAGPTRFIGNTAYSSKFGELVGYENHSGVTKLDNVKHAFASVVSGAGNNGEDGTEGCIIDNVIGTYSHGPAFSKNPQLADSLLLTALKRKYGFTELEPLNDDLENWAHQYAILRPR